MTEFQKTYIKTQISKLEDDYTYEDHVFTMAHSALISTRKQINDLKTTLFLNSNEKIKYSFISGGVPENQGVRIVSSHADEVRLREAYGEFGDSLVDLPLIKLVKDECRSFTELEGKVMKVLGVSEYDKEKLLKMSFELEVKGEGRVEVKTYYKG